MWILQRRKLEQQNGDAGAGAGGGGAGAGAGGAGGAAGAGAGAGGAGAAGGGAGSGSPWYDDTHKATVESKQWKSPNDVLTAYSGLEKLLGADRAGRTVVLPKDANDVEGRKAFFAKIGVPDSADKYELPVLDGQDKEFSGTASKWFHELGIPKESAQQLAGKWNAYVAKVIADGDAAIAAESTKELGTLKAEWAADFDKNSEMARRFAKAAGWDDAKIARYEQAFGTADLLKTMHTFGTKMGEHSFTGSDGGNTGLTPAKARERIEQIKQNRVAGSMTQEDYLKEMDSLGPIAAQKT